MPKNQKCPLCDSPLIVKIPSNSGRVGREKKARNRFKERIRAAARFPERLWNSIDICGFDDRVITMGFLEHDEL